MSSANPILNNPYEEPRVHYASNLKGELDYELIVPGRRLFSPEIPTIPVKAGPQLDLPSAVEEAQSAYGAHLINLLRREVKVWRDGDYPNTTRVTKELLHYWFLNPARENRLFFAQREAVETAIWLNEVAEKSNPGQHALSELSRKQAIDRDAANNLPRFAFKMATGTGKTVVMGALIVYHFCNRQEYRSDPRFADNFLLIAPGITIRDRLGVLRAESDDDVGAIRDYYSERSLVPHSQRASFRGLNAHLAITNFQGFQPRTLQGNKRSPFDGKLQADGTKNTGGTEDYSQVLKRVLPNFKAGTRLLVLNDEAHHCYLPKVDEEKIKADGEDAEEENKRAAVWFSGLREIARRFKVRAVYDLSATPYFLTGSGYKPYSLFPWTVSDFGLTEAIESGLVKIPYLPTRDDTDKIGEPVLRNLYAHIKEELPRSGQRTQRARAVEKGGALREAPPKIPPTLQAALDQFYQHYDEDFRRGGQLAFESTPPVFIVVCNNTSVSKEVFKFIAGYEQPSDEAASIPPAVVDGRYELFSNYDKQTRRPLARPATLLIDSDALENSGQIDESFRRVFAPEFAQFKRDYARLHGSGAASEITDAEILREVVNTVGKRGTLGAYVRCVVSVSMLTEGWDANTVTHIVGIRAFNSQLLCEQVAGRALRRKSYALAPYDFTTGEPLTKEVEKRRKRDAVREHRSPNILYKFPPEYAHVIGVPFKLFKPGKATPPDPVETVRVRALEEREVRDGIIFPNIEGYRLEYPEGPLTADLTRIDDYQIEANAIPTQTALATAVASGEVVLSLDDLLSLREAPILFRITKDLIRDHFSDDPAAPAFFRFSELLAIVSEWYATKVRVLGKGPEWKKLLYYAEPKKLVAHVARAIATGPAGQESIRPIFNYYNPTGSTRFVHGNTSKETYPTRHSHVNVVVLDSGWEGQAAKVLDDFAAEGRIVSWVKNHFLNFRIPYTDKQGESRDYLPDFIVRVNDDAGLPLRLIVEVTGARRDKPEKIWTVTERWLPAVNHLPPTRSYGRWDFLELAGQTQVADFRNILLKWLDAPANAKPCVRASVMSLRREWEATEGPITEDFELPERRLDASAYRNPFAD
ncbi:MAG: DEAD/DEAH box helicase family protein [Opitutaceae bacterium]